MVNPYSHPKKIAEAIKIKDFLPLNIASIENKDRPYFQANSITPITDNFYQQSLRGKVYPYLFPNLPSDLKGGI